VKAAAWGEFLWGVFSSSDRAGSPRVNHLSGEALRSIREECNPRTTTNPIVETYLGENRTFQENGSTEVPEKEGKGCGKGAIKHSFHASAVNTHVRLCCQKLTNYANDAILGIIKPARSPSMPMNISLTPHLEEMIREKIASGSYNSASEVVREALRLLEQADQWRSLKMQKLRQDIQEGLDSGPSTVFDPQEIKRVAREKKSAKSAK